MKRFRVDKSNMNQVFNQVCPNKTSSNILRRKFNSTSIILILHPIMLLRILNTWIQQYILLDTKFTCWYWYFTSKKVKGISLEGKLSRPLPLFNSIVWLEAMDRKMNYIFWVSGFNSILKKTFPWNWNFTLFIHTYLHVKVM